MRYPRTTRSTPRLPRRSDACRATRDGFTLVELMISLAIALVLILGIEQVFSISSKTVGAGQALSTINRDDRELHQQLYRDLRNAIVANATNTSTPAFIIQSERQYAFRNAADYAAAADPTDPSKDPVFTSSGGVIPTTFYNYRSHRIDRIGFFAAGDLYQRQTSNDGQFSSPTTSYEAYIWYGHLSLPNNSRINTPAMTPATKGWYWPGQADVSTTDRNDNNIYASEWMLGRWALALVPNPPPATPSPPGENYIDGGTTNPLAQTAVAQDGSTIDSSRYDLVKTSAQNFAVNFGTIAERDKLMAYRFQANPVPLKPLDTATGAAKMAKLAPIFVRSCTQFMVEYAGNYTTQDPVTGAMTAATPDPSPGKIDFVVDSVTKQHKVRWYGFPRDVNGDGKIDATNDVVPLRDFRGGTAASFEEFGSDFPTAPPADYRAAGVIKTTNASWYRCSWGPDTNVNDPMPKMIRVTIALDDPNGRLNDEQTFEYVLDLTQ